MGCSWGAWRVFFVLGRRGVCVLFLGGVVCVLIFGGVVVVVCVVLVFGSTCQCSSSAAVQQTGTPLVPARTPTVLLGPGQREGRGWPVWIRQQMHGKHGSGAGC